MKLFDRELSRLSYNRRVLQEAEDKNNSAAQRLKFISIANSNLKTFVRDRFLAQLNDKGEGSKKKIRELKKNLSQQFSLCGELVSEIFQSQLQNEISIATADSLDEVQTKYVQEWYRLKMKPALRVQYFTSGNEMLSIENSRLYLLVQLTYHNENGSAIIEIPFNGENRFVEIPSSGETRIFIAAEEVLRMNLPSIFPGHQIPGSYLFEMISGDEFYSPDDERELSDKWKKGKKKTESFFLFEKNIPNEAIDLIIAETNGSRMAVAKKNSLLSVSDFVELSKAKIISEELKISSALPVQENEVSIFNQVKKIDCFFYFPYHSFHSVIQLLNEAAENPEVKKIFMTLYRTAQPSSIAQSLIRAAANGKKIFVFLEVKASDNEEENILLARKLEASGITVERNFPGLKVHAKILLIESKVENSTERIALFNTGNFNEKTATQYTDVAICTSDNSITESASEFFKSLQQKTISISKDSAVSFSPVSFRQTISTQIQKCVMAARKNSTAHIIIKVNNLDDEKIIAELYEAAEAGVHIDIIVRTICCMKPKENIRIVSIVDELLEHARIFSFQAGDEKNVFLASADLMVRNLDRRIEFLLPVKDKKIQEQLFSILKIQLRDNVKARIIDKKQKNNFVEAVDDEAHIRSQQAVAELLNNN